MNEEVDLTETGATRERSVLYQENRKRTDTVIAGIHDLNQLLQSQSVNGSTISSHLHVAKGKDDVISGENRINPSLPPSEIILFSAVNTHFSAEKRGLREISRELNEPMLTVLELPFLKIALVHHICCDL